MSGYSRTGSRVNAMIPKSRIARLITVARTGRRIDVRLSFIASLPRPPAVRRAPPGIGMTFAPSNSFWWPARDDLHPRGEPLEHFHDVRRPRPEP